MTGDDAETVAQAWFERWQREGKVNLVMAVADLLRRDRRRRPCRPASRSRRKTHVPPGVIV